MQLYEQLLDHQQGVDIDPNSIVSSIITDSGISEASETPFTTIFDRTSGMAPINSSQSLNAHQQTNVGETGHSRNSSNTSQVCIKIYENCLGKIFTHEYFTFRCPKAPVIVAACQIDSIHVKALMVIQVILGKLDHLIMDHDHR